MAPPKKEDELPIDSKPTEKIAVFDYLRTFAILLVLLHHAILAYVTFAQLNPATPFTFAPVVDSQKWSGFDLIALFNDTWFMALLFFISGLFVWKSLTRKGAWIFLRDRLIRLGIPFVIGVILLIPLAYFPGQLEIEQFYGGSTSYIDFWLGMVSAGFGTAGPLWFLCVLLAFNCLIAVLYGIAPHLDDIIKLRVSAIMNHTIAFFGVLLGISTVAYLPMVLVFGINHWTTIGPITFQTSRILFYLVYFLLGTAVGVYGLSRTMFNSKSKFARRGWIWMIVSPLSFVVVIIFLINPNPTGLIFYGIALTFTCAAAVFGFISIFLRFTNRRVGILDSLSNNSYGIYIVHYVFVTWLQYFLLDIQLPAILKALIAFSGTLILSWGSVAAIRRIPTVARVI